MLAALSPGKIIQQGKARIGSQSLSIAHSLTSKIWDIGEESDRKEIISECGTLLGHQNEGSIML